MIQKYNTSHISVSGVLNKGQTNLAHIIFYQIHQVAARATKLVLGVQLGPPIWGKVRLYEVTDGTIQKSNGGFL